MKALNTHGWALFIRFYWSFGPLLLFGSDKGLQVIFFYFWFSYFCGSSHIRELKLFAFCAILFIDVELNLSKTLLIFV
jgi:hypothetical protein